MDSFLPPPAKDAADDLARREGCARVEMWVLEAIPSEFRRGATVQVQEVQCEENHPIDTALCVHFPSGGKAAMGLPLESKDLSREFVLENMPPRSIWAAWARNEDAEWLGPSQQQQRDGGGVDQDDLQPQQSSQDGGGGQRPWLRFDVGMRVVCRVGPDPVKGWASGRVVQTWYREPGWPAKSWAPYKVELDDGRNIFAPGDVDQIIQEA